MNFGDGTWRIGDDILPGTYRTDNTGSCYWERLSDFTGDFQAILANGTPSGPVIVTISSTDAGFTSQRCGEWVLADTIEPVRPRTQIDDGTWRVAVDIEAGTCWAAERDGCYWERVSGFSGDFTEIVANDNPIGPAVITIGSLDVGFTSNGCGTWVLAEIVAPARPLTQISDGTWRVGIDIEPGTYRTEGTESCYWERLNGFSGEFGDLIANDFSTGQAIVSILQNDAGFTSQGCGNWTR